MRVVQRVRGFVRSAAKAANGGPPEPAPAARPESGQKVDDATVAVEREVLKVALQLPGVAGPEFDALEPPAFLVAAHRKVREAIAAAGGSAAAKSGPEWTAAVQANLDPALHGGVTALVVEPLHSDADDAPRYVAAVLARMHEIVASRRVAALKSKLQRINPLEQPDEHSRLFGELISLEAYRRQLRERAIGTP
jgi:DNA primase